MHRVYGLALLAACGRVAFDPVDGDGDGGTMLDDGGTATSPGDGTLGDGGPPPWDGPINGCVTPAVGCAFDGTTPCSCWGTAMQVAADITESAGRVTVSPMNAVGAYAGCSRVDVPFDARGVVVEISRVLSCTAGVTSLELVSSTHTIRMFANDGQLALDDGIEIATITYAPALTRWWRIRPAGTGIVFETAGDAVAWTTNKFSSRVPSAMYDVALVAHTTMPTSTAGTARFEGINVCP